MAPAEIIGKIGISPYYTTLKIVEDEGDYHPGTLGGRKVHIRNRLGGDGMIIETLPRKFLGIPFGRKRVAYPPGEYVGLDNDKFAVAWSKEELCRKKR